MALTAAEQQEMSQLQGELGGAGGASGGNSLSPDEQAEMAQLQKEVGGSMPPRSASTPTQSPDNGSGWKDHVRPWLDALPTAGMVAGGALGLESGPGALVTAGLGGAAGEALKNLGEKYILGEDKSRSDIYGNPVKGFVEGVTAEMGGQAIGGAIESAPAGAKWVAQKIGKVFSNIPEETTGRYMTDPAAINAAPPRQKIADDILDLKNQAQQQVSDAHQSLQDAKDALSQNKGDVRGALQDQKFQAGQDLNEAQTNFNEKKQQFKEALQSNNLTSMATDVMGAVKDLKQKVIDGSAQAYDILGKSNASVDVDPLIQSMQDKIDGMRINGTFESPQAEQASQELRGWQTRLFEMTKGSDGQLSGPQAKQVMQAIDKSVNYSNQAGTFAPDTEAALTGVRKLIDQDVKGQVPEYAQKMSDVAQKTNLLGQTSDLYGTPEKAIQNLNNIDSEKGQALHVPLINQLSEQTGKDLSSSVNGYLLNQKILSTPSLFNQAVENLPEAKALNAARSKMTAISDPEYSRSLIESSNAPYEAKLNSASDNLDSAKANASTLSGITPDSITAKTKALNGANAYGAEDKFGKIDSTFGTDFSKQIQARNDLDQFSKEDTNGSRKTMLGTVTGGVVGLLTGHPWLGLELGAAAGNVADRYSGPMFKSALDAAMKAGPVAKSIGESGRIMPAVVGSIGSPKLTETGVAPAAAAPSQPQKGPDKWANDGFQNLLEHSGNDKTIAAARDQLLSTPQGRKLLISASDLKPGSKAMQNILDRVRQNIGASP